jgi:hypothetical protein
MRFAPEYESERPKPSLVQLQANVMAAEAGNPGAAPGSWALLAAGMEDGQRQMEAFFKGRDAMEKQLAGRRFAPPPPPRPSLLRRVLARLTRGVR